MAEPNGGKGEEIVRYFIDRYAASIASAQEERVVKLEAALQRIVALNPDIHSASGWNEWGEADCFNQAQKIASAALTPEALVGGKEQT